MKIFMNIIQFMADGTSAILPVATYTDGISAEAAFHSNAASAIAQIQAGTIKACLIKSFNEVGVDLPDISKYFNNVEPVEPS